MNRYKSLCITVRPKKGVVAESKYEEDILKWCKKQDYAYVVAEMEDEARHLHIQIWSNKAKTRGEVQTAMVRIAEKNLDDWDDAQKKVLRNGVRIAYSDWCDNYLGDNDEKGEANILFEKVPTKTLEFYPTEEEQEALLNTSNAVDKRFHRLTEMYKENSKYYKEPTITNVARFLSDMMFKQKTIPVIVCQKHREQLCMSLWAYIQESIMPDLFLSKDLSNRYIVAEKMRNPRDSAFDLIMNK